MRYLRVHTHMSLFWPGISSLRWWSSIFCQKLQLTYPQASLVLKDAQAAGEAFNPQKRTSSTSKHKIVVGGSLHYWPCMGAAVLTTHLIGQLSEAFMCKKRFSIYFFLHIISLICTVFKLCCLRICYTWAFSDQGFHPWGGEAWAGTPVGWRGGWVWPCRRSYHHEPARSRHYLPRRISGTVQGRGSVD